MYKGIAGIIVSYLAKLALTIMIMMLVMYVAYFIGYYDSPDFSLETANGLENVVNNMLNADLNTYGVEIGNGWGILATVLSAALELCCRLSSTQYSPDMFTSAAAISLIMATVMTTISVSVPLKLYLAMAKNINKKASTGLTKFFNYAIDFFCVALVALLGIISAGCLTRRVSIINSGLPSWLNFIIYIVILIVVALILALLDGKFNKNNKGLLTTVINIAGELLYSVLIATEVLCTVAVFLILKSFNGYNVTQDYFIIFGIGIACIGVLIATILISKRK